MTSRYRSPLPYVHRVGDGDDRGDERASVTRDEDSLDVDARQSAGSYPNCSLESR